MSARRVALVVGARPNYFKAAPLLARLDAHPGFEALLVHTGQHYDASLYQALFAQLGLREPDVYLGETDRRKSVPEMTADFSAWLAEAKVDAVVVVGDVDSTASSALASHYSGVPVAHVEAGLRSRDRSMPEEINRILTDTVSSLLLVSDPAGVDNLAQEGRGGDEVVLIGNVMIDTLLDRLPAARALPPAAELEPLGERAFGLATLHRPGNVDEGPRLARWVEALIQASQRLPLVFPIHPRTLRSLQAHGLEDALRAAPDLICTGPVGYLEVVALQDRASVVLSDSAGLAEEASVLGTPCLTLRPNTERPITVEQGTAVLVPEPEDLAEHLARVLAGEHPERGGIELWDGRAAVRAVAALERWLSS